MLDYRIARVDQARAKARSYGKDYSGAMYPWESAFSGVEECPLWANTGKLEQHITGDIAFAAQQFWHASHNTTWLKHAFEPLIGATADFWVSRVQGGQGSDNFHIRNVVPPDEYHSGDDSAYTNYMAQRNLRFAAEAATLLGMTPNPAWLSTADKLFIPFHAQKGIHLEFDNYTGDDIKQADVVLLGYPAMMPMPTKIRRADLEYYAPRTDRKAGPAMTWSMYAIAHLELGDTAKASLDFDRAFIHNAQPPFYAWTETPAGGAYNFITGMGGFMQALLFGLAGIRVHSEALEVHPSLVEGINSATARGMHYQGAMLSLTFDIASMTIANCGPTSGGPLIKVLSAETREVLSELKGEESWTNPRSHVFLQVEADYMMV